MEEKKKKLTGTRMTSHVFSLSFTPKMLIRGLINLTLLILTLIFNFSLFYASSSSNDHDDPSAHQKREVIAINRLADDLKFRGDLWKQSPLVSLCNSGSERETLESCREAGLKFDPKNCKCRYDYRFRQRNTSVFLEIMANAPETDADETYSHCQLTLSQIEVPQNENRLRHPSHLTGLSCVDQTPYEKSLGGAVCVPKETFTRYELVEVFENGGFHIGSELITLEMPRACQVIPRDSCVTPCFGGKGLCRIQVVQSCPDNFGWNMATCQCECSLSQDSCLENMKFNEQSCSCTSTAVAKYDGEYLSDADCERLVHCSGGILAKAVIKTDGARVCICPSISLPKPLNVYYETTVTQPPSAWSFWFTTITQPITTRSPKASMYQPIKTAIKTDSKDRQFTWPIVIPSRLRTLTPRTRVTFSDETIRPETSTATTTKAALTETETMTYTEIDVIDVNEITSKRKISVLCGKMEFIQTTTTTQASSSTTETTVGLTEKSTTVEEETSTTEMATSSTEVQNKSTELITSTETYLSPVSKGTQEVEIALTFAPDKPTTTTATFNFLTSTISLVEEERICLETGACEEGFQRYYNSFTRTCICSCLGIDLYPRWLCKKLMFWQDNNYQESLFL